MAAYPGLAAFHTATRGPVQSSDQSPPVSRNFQTGPSKNLEFRGAATAMGPLWWSGGKGIVFERHGERRSSPREARAIAASAQIRPDRPETRHRPENVACWGINGRAGSMAGESVVSQNRTPAVSVSCVCIWREKPTFIVRLARRTKLAKPAPQRTRYRFTSRTRNQRWRQALFDAAA